MIPTAKNGQRILLLGATGAVGSQVLRLALAHPAVVQVVAPTRRALSFESTSPCATSGMATMSRTRAKWRSQRCTRHAAGFHACQPSATSSKVDTLAYTEKR